IDTRVDPVKLLKDVLDLLFGDADSCIPDLDAQICPTPSAAEQNLALLGELHGVGKQIADHLLQELWIAPDGQMAGNCAQANAVCLGMIREFYAQLLEEFTDWEVGLFRTNDAGFDLVDIEESVEHAQHDIRGLVELSNQRQCILLLDFLGQSSSHQAQGLKQLS